MHHFFRILSFTADNTKKFRGESNLFLKFCLSQLTVTIKCSYYCTIDKYFTVLKIKKKKKKGRHYFFSFLIGFWRPLKLFGDPWSFLATPGAFCTPKFPHHRTLIWPTYGTFLQPNNFHSKFWRPLLMATPGQPGLRYATDCTANRIRGKALKQYDNIPSRGGSWVA